MFKAITKFLHEARVELAKVTWPTRQAAINLTLIVIGISVLFMLYITVIDYGFTTGIKWVAQQAAQIKSGESSFDPNAISNEVLNNLKVTPITDSNQTNQ